MDGDKRDARLGQPPRKEQRLAEAVTTVAIAARGGLGVEREDPRPAIGSPRQEYRLPADRLEFICRVDRWLPALEERQHRRSRLEPLGRDTFGKRENPGSLAKPRLAIHGERIVTRAEEARAAPAEECPSSLVLAGDAAPHCNLGQSDISGKRAAPTLELRDDAPHVGEVHPLRRADVVVHGWLRGVPAGERVINHRRVVSVGMAHGPDERELARQGRKPGEVLAYLGPRHARPDRPEWPPDLGGCIRLQVESIQVRWPPKQVNEDA